MEYKCIQNWSVARSGTGNCLPCLHLNAFLLGVCIFRARKTGNCSSVVFCSKWEKWLPQFFCFVEPALGVEGFLGMKMQKLKYADSAVSGWYFVLPLKKIKYVLCGYLPRFAQRAKCTYSSTWASRPARWRQPTPFTCTRWRGRSPSSTWRTGACARPGSQPLFRVLLRPRCSRYLAAKFFCFAQPGQTSNSEFQKLLEKERENWCRG